jgi:hypothetical protein
MKRDPMWRVGLGVLAAVVVIPLALVLMSDPPAVAGPSRTAASASVGVGSGWYHPPNKTAADYCTNNGVTPVASTMMESGGIVMQLPQANVYKGKITSIVAGGGHYYGYADADATVTLDSGKTMTVRLSSSQLSVALSALERSSGVELATRANPTTCTGPAVLEYLKL